MGYDNILLTETCGMQTVTEIWHLKILSVAGHTFIKDNLCLTFIYFLYNKTYVVALSALYTEYI